MASLLASVVNTNGLVKTGYCGKGSVVNDIFRVEKLFLFCHSKYKVFFFKSSVNGLAILLKFGMNLL